ncbi:unnamed protein product, partial [Ectocarpus sp. 13 AM-2016]
VRGAKSNTDEYAAGGLTREQGGGTQDRWLRARVSHKRSPEFCCFLVLSSSKKEERLRSVEVPPSFPLMGGTGRSAIADQPQYMLCLPSVLLLAKQLEHSVHPTDIAVTERWIGCPERVAPNVGAAG